MQHVHPSIPTSIGGYTAVQNGSITYNVPTRTRTALDCSIPSSPRQSARQSTQQSTRWHCVPSQSMITQRAGIIPADDTGSHRTNRTNPHPHQNLNDNQTMTLIHCLYQRPPATNCCDLWLLIRNRLPINESPMKRRHVVVLVSLGEQLSILTVGTFYSLNTMHTIPTLISQHTEFTA